MQAAEILQGRLGAAFSMLSSSRRRRRSINEFEDDRNVTDSFNSTESNSTDIAQGETIYFFDLLNFC